MDFSEKTPFLKDPLFPSPISGLNDINAKRRVFSNAKDLNTSPDAEGSLSKSQGTYRSVFLQKVSVLPRKSLNRNLF